MISCPYCAERFEVVIDLSEPDQAYIEDCYVCCRPIQFSLQVDEMGGTELRVSHENE